ncbi:MAG TPA: ATP-binding protein [Solirubrobacteraceae bacterium]|jgi:hypothetical protein|nr:ATP-binding protein [Solirubrobacteraceae bacterium]
MTDPSADSSARRDDRAGALDAVAGAVASAAGGSGAVVVVGPPDVLDDAQARAVGAGLAVLRARASEAERGSPFAVARQLLAPALAGLGPARRAKVLRGAARLAAPLLEPAPLGAGAERDLSAIHGLYWLTSNLADLHPLAMLVDDAEWADAASVRLFAYLAQRIDELPVALVLGTRSGALEALGGSR